MTGCSLEGIPYAPNTPWWWVEGYLYYIVEQLRVGPQHRLSRLDKVMQVRRRILAGKVDKKRVIEIMDVLLKLYLPT